MHDCRHAGHVEVFACFNTVVRDFDFICVFNLWPKFSPTVLASYQTISHWCWPAFLQSSILDIIYKTKERWFCSCQRSDLAADADAVVTVLVCTLYPTTM
jgi:hypothetical protein